MREWLSQMFQRPEEVFIPGERVQVTYGVPTNETGLIPVWPVIIPWRRYKEVQAYGTVVEFPVKPANLDDRIGVALFGSMVSVQVESGKIYNIHSEWVQRAPPEQNKTTT